MATISANTEEGVFKIEQFLGLNENPDGDTKLRNGEASYCINWRVTRDRNLTRRPGSLTVADMGTGEPVVGLWFGSIKGNITALAASGGHLWKIYEPLVEDFKDNFFAEDLGEIDCSTRVSFLAFNDEVYMLNGKEYMVYDGTELKDVVGYRPLIYTAVSPDGSIEAQSKLEQVNKLNGLRRVWFSPDGESTVFYLPEADLMSIDYVIYTADESEYDRSKYALDPYAGTVTFTVAPSAGVNTIEIGYSAAAPYRYQVTRMTDFELYSGTTDSRVFIYGDGSNECFYSSIDYDGTPRADYFPDLNEIAVGDKNTPITGLIRHYSQLVCFKTNSAWMMSYGTITLADGNATESFYVIPVNKAKGNEAKAQIMLVDNSPRTLCGNDLYEWRNTSSYSSNLTVDERQAKRMSDRIYNTLGKFDFSQCICFDDGFNTEYYIICGNQALVNNYAADAWYKYEGLDIRSIASVDGEAVFGTSDGKIKWLSSRFANDDGIAFRSYWKSGANDFGKNYMRKSTSSMWVGIKPEANASVTVTVQTDKKLDCPEKEMSFFVSTFEDVDFADWTFETKRQPTVKKLKIKAKKFVYLYLIYETESMDEKATILATDIRVRFTGYAK